MLTYLLVIGCVYFANVLAIVTNVLLIFLSITERAKEIKDFRVVIVINSLIDLGCALINLYSRPVSFWEDFEVYCDV